MLVGRYGENEMFVILSVGGWWNETVDVSTSSMVIVFVGYRVTREILWGSDDGILYS